MRVPAVRDYLRDSKAATVLARLRAQARAGSLPSQPPGIEEWLEPGKSTIEVLNWFTMSRMFKMAGDEDVLHGMYAMRARLMHAPFGSHFITSDQPVGLYHPCAAQLPGVAVSTRGVEVSLPLSSRAALVLDHAPGKSTELLATTAQVKEINRRTATMAQRFLFTFDAPDKAVELAHAVSGWRAGFEYKLLKEGKREGFELRFVAVGPDNPVY